MVGSAVLSQTQDKGRQTFCRARFKKAWEGIAMLRKTTLLDDTEINQFFKDNQSAYLVKYILFHNKILDRNEHHVVYSLDTKMMNGRHLQR
jgi:hypothetical protein